MSFLDRVLKHPNLPFATDDEENIYNLKKEFAVSAKTCAKMSKSQLLEAHKEKIRKKTMGRVLLEAHKEKIYKKAMGRVLLEAHKEKICKKATILHLFVILRKQISNT
jgi:hypothetical protein